MAEETNKQDNLTKFPNAEKANQEAPAGLPSAFDLFSPSVKIITNNLVPFLILVAIPLSLLLIGQGSHVFKSGANSDLLNSSNGALGIFGMLGLILSLLAAPGTVVLQLAGVRKQAITWGEAFKRGLQQFWHFFGLVLLMIIILTASFLLFIVPFFIVLPRIFLAPYFMIDQKLGVGASLKASNEAYRAHKGTWGVIGVFILLNLTAIIPIIGSIAANALTFLYGPASALRYEQIKLLSADKAPVTPAEAKTTSAA